MPRWIGLFRGMNVGGRNILPMKDLVRDLQSLDLENIETYIQSGNVVFETSREASAKLGARIAETIAARHGFRPHVLILDTDRLKDAIETNPFPGAESDPKTLQLYFLAATPAAPDLASLTEIKSPSERFRLIDRVFYLHAPDGIGRSRLAGKVEKHLGVTATARNWRTVIKLWEMVADR